MQCSQISRDEESKELRIENLKPVADEDGHCANNFCSTPHKVGYVQLEENCRVGRVIAMHRDRTKYDFQGEHLIVLDFLLHRTPLKYHAAANSTESNIDAKGRCSFLWILRTHSKRSA